MSSPQEYVIFETAITNSFNKETTHAVLFSDKDTGLMFVNPKSVEIEEHFGSVSPILNVTFIDGNGDLINHNILDVDANFYLMFGNYSDDVEFVKMKPIDVSFMNQQMGQSKDVKFTVKFVHTSWDEMVTMNYERSWSREHSYGEIIYDLVARKFNGIDIRNPTKSVEKAIQPNWNNASYLRWISERCDSNGNGHYEFGVTKRGEFFFKSIGDIVGDSKRSISNDSLPTFRMNGDEYKSPDDMMKEDKKDPESKKTEQYVARFSGSERYMDSIYAGAGGVTPRYYDFDTATYTIDNQKLSDLTIPQITDWTWVKKSHEGSSNLSIDIGRNRDDADIITYNRLSRTLYSMRSFDISVEGNPDVDIGDMIEILIPTPKNIGTVASFSEFYSGFYIIKGMSTKINMDKHTTVTVMTLASSGFNSKELVGYTVTAAGKFDV